jgi:hypothetical protein
MTWNEANTAAQNLWLKWVSANPAQSILTHGPDTQHVSYDLDRIHASMLQEFRWHCTGRSSASAGLISETKGELILLGKIRKALCN